MSDNATVTTQGSPDDTQAPRTFTQEEVNAIVGKRLADEKSKFADYEELKTKALKFDEAEEASKSELQKATERAEALQKELEGLKKANEIESVRNKVAQALGVPADLLTGDDEEACTLQANKLLEFAKKTTYPSMPDGGESHSSTLTKSEILGIKDEKARLKAIRENIELFK